MDCSVCHTETLNFQKLSSEKPQLVSRIVYLPSVATSPPARATFLELCLYFKMKKYPKKYYHKCSVCRPKTSFLFSVFMTQPMCCSHNSQYQLKREKTWKIMLRYEKRQETNKRTIASNCDTRQAITRFSTSLFEESRRGHTAFNSSMNIKLGALKTSNK